MKLLIALIVGLVSISVGAAEARTQKAERIAQVLGLEELLADAQRANAQSIREQVQIVMQEFRRNGMKESLLREYEKAADQMAAKVNAAWDPKQATRIYSEGLLESLSDQELNEAEQYFSSPEGQKAYAAVSSSQAKMTEYINSRTNAVMQEEFAKFMEQVRQAAAKK